MPQFKTDLEIELDIHGDDVNKEEKEDNEEEDKDKEEDDIPNNMTMCTNENFQCDEEIRIKIASLQKDLEARRFNNSDMAITSSLKSKIFRKGEI